MTAAIAVAVRAHAIALTQRGDALVGVGVALRNVEVPKEWTGAAADAFTTAFGRQPARWFAAGDAHHDAATAVSHYADVLEWAQAQSSAAAGSRPVLLGDQGTEIRELLARIAAQVTTAGDVAARAVLRAANTAPSGSFLTDGLNRLTNDVSDIATGISAATAPAASTITPTFVDGAGRLVPGALPQLGDVATIGPTLPGIATTGGLTPTLPGLSTTGGLTPPVDAGERLEARKRGPKPEGVVDDNPPPGVPKGWIKRPTENGHGWYWQRPGVTDQSDQVRIMDPDADPRYPDGYVKFYNGHNQPIRPDGKPGSRADSHMPRRPDGSYDIPPGW